MCVCEYGNVLGAQETYNCQRTKSTYFFFHFHGYDLKPT